MEQVNARSIFSPATGFIRRGGFDWTCNPYLGCSFGCTYCYAMFLPQNCRPKDEWGKWFSAKVNAIELARKHAPKLAGQAVYISSVTDPYLPAERSLRLTRGVLEALVPQQPRILIQTRGPLVVRDVDLFTQFQAIRINMSIPTDSEDVRKVFEPKAPPIEQRWQAVSELQKAGIPIGICVTPTLPLEDPAAFAERLRALKPDVLVVQDFHNSNGAFGADTGEKARQLLRKSGWCTSDYERFKTELRQLLSVYEGEEGFFPPSDRPIVAMTSPSHTQL